MEHVGPLFFSFSYLIEFLFNLTGIADFDKLIVEAFLKEFCNCFTKCGRIKSPFALFYIATIFDDIDNACIGRRPSDSFFL